MTRRDEILAAALESFAASGETAIEDVRRRSGASIGSIYHHFDGKEGIATALYLQILAEYQAQVVRVLDGSEDAEKGIEALVRCHLRWVERNRDRAGFLLHGNTLREAVGEELEGLNRGFSAAMAGWVEQRPQIRPLRHEVFYAVVFGPAQEASRLWLAGRIRSLRRLEDELAAAAWRAVRASSG